MQSSAIAIGSDRRLAAVTGQKKLDRKYAEHLAAILRPIVKDQFDGNQTAFAKHIGVSQSQMSSILKQGGGDRSVGINVLIRIRAYLGTMTLDEMLDLPPLLRRAVPPLDLEQAVERALDRRFPEKAKSSPRLLPPPAPPKRKRLE